MENLTQSPYLLTDEDILWVGDTLADMTPVKCENAVKIKETLQKGLAPMFVYKNGENAAHANECIKAGVVFAYVAGEGTDEAARALRDMGFNGTIYTDGEALRAAAIEMLGLQAFLGLHKK